MSDDCWNRIGVEGDRTCPQLKAVIHCHNCSVYSLAGRSLLEREAPLDYLQEWTNILANTQPEHSLAQTDGAIARSREETFSVIIFCLGDEFLALPVKLLQEVTQPCVIHTLPHRSNELFTGLVNIRGEILLCISLGYLLNLVKIADSSQKHSLMASARMIVVSSQENKWVFPVEQVSGFHRFTTSDLQNTPVVVAKASAAYTKGVIYWQGKKVNYLDSDLLFYTLSRRIL